MARSTGPTTDAAGDYYSPESDLHHVKKAHRIYGDPKRLKAVMALAGQQHAENQAVMSGMPPGQAPMTPAMMPMPMKGGKP